MSLSANWALYFDNAAKVGGRACFDEQAVQPHECGLGEMFRAEVRDEAGDCTVTVQGEGEPDDFACSCQTFADGRFCKHIWAALLYLEHHADQLDTEVSTPIGEGHRLPKARKRSGDRPASRDAEPEWISRLNLVRTSSLHDEHNGAAERPDFMQVCYVIDPELCRQRQQLVVELFQRRLGAQGWTKPKHLKIDASCTATLPETEDRELCALLMGADWIARQNGSRSGRASGVDYYDYYESPRTRSAYGVAPHAWWGMLRRMLDTQRCFIATEQGPQPLMLDDRPDADPWVLWLMGEVNDAQLELTIELRREHHRMAIERPTLVLSGTEADGMVVYDGKVARFDDRQAGKWVSHFRDDLHKYGEVRPIVVPMDEVPRFLERLYLLADLPEIDLPPGVGRGEEHIEAVPMLELTSPPSGSSRKLLGAQVYFAYGPHRVMPGQRGRFVASAAALDSDSDTVPQTLNGEHVADLPAAAGPLIRRDLHREQVLYASLLRAGFHPGTGAESDRLFIAVKRMPTVVNQLIQQGWHIAADQRVVRAAAAPHLSVSSGIDWFELRGSVAYETAHGIEQITLPQILQALKQGHTTIKLDDGSEGLLPHEWLQQHGLLTAMGKVQDDHLQFRLNQAAMLDALLARQEHVTCDETFAAAREQLHQFDGITPLHPAPTFVGSLRPYQCEGLGWCQFLRTFAMGGILADDMGLGKTVQILAMLDSRYGEKSEIPDPESQTLNPKSPSHRPTLIVVPRSVVFNWMDEARKFAPRLRVQAYTGSDRHALREAFVDHDVIITSYGLMRRDIDELRDHHFDYIVLDEAQAIKNPASQSAKAARLLHGDHKLALTGTPVENHLGDLWSIFEFLNPGMLGSSTRFAELLRQGVSTDTVTVRNGANDPNASIQIARALRPFILRRTKQQVLRDLPEKTEQTIHCEMEPEQRAIYDEMRSYYRQTLLSHMGRPADGSTTIFQNGAGSSATPMLVLEALLRLRQAACHPALINEKYADKPSAKLEVLMDRLSDLIDEGHKALVFSQFTSMLALVRKQLDDRGIPYAYLDGQTRKRKQVVDRFQNDSNCPVFLISLKAGGFGLNLTAAEYVFILDPWWNPAVEAQAIDRTHRIGQTQHVFAYRLICEETVEQRILELQDKKKRLADAIIGGQENLLRSLTRDDLERLLS